MQIFRRTDADVSARLRRYRWGLALLATLSFLYLIYFDSNSSIASALLYLPTAMLIGSFIFTDGTELDQVTVSEDNIRYGNRVYPIEKVSKIRVRKTRSGNLSIKIWATDMDSLSIPALPELDQFIETLLQRNPLIEVIEK